MAVGSNYTPPAGGNVGAYGQTPVGGPSRQESPQELRERLATEDAQKAADEAARLRSGGEPGQVRTKTVKVRVPRNRGGAENANGANGANGSEQTGRAGRAGRNGHVGGLQNRDSGYYMLQSRSLAGSSLSQAHHQFQSQQAQNPQNQPSNLGVRNRMLTGLNNYIQNDYQMMKLNPEDKAFTYRTAEARQLGATIGQMVASSTRQGNTAPKTNEDTPPRGLSKEAYGRQKSLMVKLRAMSEPHPKLPDNLPADYAPFESVA